jgi:hypothetical protein
MPYHMGHWARDYGTVDISLLKYEHKRFSLFVLRHSGSNVHRRIWPLSVDWTFVWTFLNVSWAFSTFQRSYWTTWTTRNKRKTHCKLQSPPSPIFDHRPVPVISNNVFLMYPCVLKRPQAFLKHLGRYRMS